MRLNLLYCLLIFTLINSCSPPPIVEKFESSWSNVKNRNWIGPEYWANSLQDWKIKDGKLLCTGQKPLRTLHLLTRELSNDSMGTLNMSVRIGALNNKGNETSWAGFIIGAGTIENDYRKRALIHGKKKNGSGIIAAINAKGKLEFFDNNNKLKKIILWEANEEGHPKVDEKGIELQLEVFKEEGGYSIKLSSFDFENAKLLSVAIIKQIPQQFLSGNIGLVKHGETGEPVQFWFNKWTVYGTKAIKQDQRTFGPVMGTLYTIGQHGLKLNAQLAPISMDELQHLRMFITLKGKNDWKEVAEQIIDTAAYTATFNFANWDRQHDYDYKLVYKITKDNGILQEYNFNGSINKEPDSNKKIQILALNNIQNTPDNNNSFPHANLIKNIGSLTPDLIYFTGNQIDKNFPFPAKQMSYNEQKMDYLYRWYLWYWTFGDVVKNTPTVLLMAEKDYLQDKLWGDNATQRTDKPKIEYPYRYWRQKHFWANDNGGFMLPAKLINNIQKMQTGHLPSPADTTVSAAGILSYYTNIKYSDIGFAIIESQKYKTPPLKVLKEFFPVNGFVLNTDVKVKNFNVIDAILLGEAQNKFLTSWAGDWMNESVKVVLSSKNFAKISSFTDSLFQKYEEPDISDKLFDYNENLELKSKDMHYHGWPQNERDNTLSTIRKGLGFIITAGERTGSLTHFGIKNWGDASIAFAVPPVYNNKPGRWLPKKLNKYQKPRMDNDNYDGFGNKITVLAATNPTKKTEKYYAAGFGLITIDKQAKTIESDIKLIVDNKLISAANWPITTSINDNNMQEKKYFLPSISFSDNKTSVIIQIRKEQKDELVYSRRINTANYQPMVSQKGKYKIIIINPQTGEKTEKRELKASTVTQSNINITL